MRLDKFLTVAGIVRSRTYSKLACVKGYIRVNGKTAKASYTVKPGDIVEIDIPLQYLKIRIVEVPKSKQVRKSERTKLYSVLERRKFNLH